MAYKGPKAREMRVLPFPSHPHLIENIRAPTYLPHKRAERWYDRIAERLRHQQ